jgi:hypothetical protein
VQEPFWAPSGYAIGAMVGAGLSVFALAGALPLIGWACVKFRPSRAVVPMLAWLMIGAGFAYLIHVGNHIDHQLKIDKFVSNGGLVGKEKEDSCGRRNLVVSKSNDPIR